MFSIFINEGGNKPTTRSETLQRRASHIRSEKRACASGDTAEQLGGVMFRFRYKGGEKMGAKRCVGLAADTGVFTRGSTMRSASSR